MEPTHCASTEAGAVQSGRLSFVLDLRGPSLTVDTACSASLTAVHLACRSLQTGECSQAIVAGVNLVLSPSETIAYSQSGMLASDGWCKFGDRNADGFVRSDGVAAVALKPLRDAIVDGDRVRAVIRGSAMTNDGRSSGLLTAPSVEGQAGAIAAACAAARVTPACLDYVEAHGTGTPVGDPVELEALAKVVGPGRLTGNPCLVGSVKTNIGHAEGAAGLIGLVKTVLCLERRAIPPSLHLYARGRTDPGGRPGCDRDAHRRRPQRPCHPGSARTGHEHLTARAPP
ncbi:polyketide synthase [Streptomyces sp. b94]|uniref:beta-ketoacyl [acyl carrier protein] synthase domain-containing protein n=1 Tax=Streptomyces sp. b94 TaxID=1827634 RepID=UPI0027DB5B67|nr:polyketide synthase [Streptomyces sp. b94]